ncbi:hypothetical protein [uncultured Rikenella sp.]|nr:hypothetical protein [uncultured Rikenella sp.]
MAWKIFREAGRLGLFLTQRRNGAAAHEQKAVPPNFLLHQAFS